MFSPNFPTSLSCGFLGAHTKNVEDVGGGFKHVYSNFIIRNLGDMIQLDEDIFQLGWNHQLEDVEDVILAMSS